MAASTLEAYGMYVSHVTVHGADLWVQTPSSRILRVEVKTAKVTTRTPTRAKQIGPPRYSFGKFVMSPDSIDAIIYVALDKNLLLVGSPYMLRYNLSPINFTPEKQNGSILEFFY